MNRANLKWIIVGLVWSLSAVSAAAYYGTNRVRRHKTGETLCCYKPAMPASAVTEFDGYKGWAKVNTTPQYLASKLDMLCRMPTQPELDAEKQDPHVHHWMLCYINPVGEDAMLHQKSPKFPVGSVIVKEKLESEAANAPVSQITGMIKHSSGYDPAHGDWEFVDADGSNTELHGRGKLANCGGCHAEKKNSDYVFRDEMDHAFLAKLR